METVIVGDPGNPADSTTGFGAVNAVYAIGKYEVTNAQYVAFLNAVDAGGTNPARLYSGEMTLDSRGGILFDPLAPAGSKYGVKANKENKPVVWVNWFDAARFCNWMANGQGGASMETGAYTLTGLGHGVVASPPKNGINPNTGLPPTYWIPSEDEWYKAAYYDPGSGGSAERYWLYPTRSDSVPAVALLNATGDISNPGSNVANYNYAWDSPDGNVTTAGSAGELSAGFYGTFDQGGNVAEIVEGVSAVRLNLRGGSWQDIAASLAATGGESRRFNSLEFRYVGFRVAALIAPVSSALQVQGGAVPGAGISGSGIPAGATWIGFSPPAINDAETVAFAGKWKSPTGGSSGIFVDGALVVNATDSVPGIPGAKWKSFGDPVLAADGAGVAWIGEIKGGSVTGADDVGVWWKPEGEPALLVVRKGGPAAGVPAAKWKSFDALALPAAGRGPIIQASLASGSPGAGGVTNATGAGVWAVDSTNTLQLLFRNGVTKIDGQTVKRFTVLEPSKSLPGVTRSFNSDATVVWLADFTDGTSAIIRTTVP